MVLTRKLFSGNPTAASDVKLYPHVIDLLCRAATKIELAMLIAGLRFPFGGSIIAVAVRAEAPDG
jgi:hypothetical protein